MTNLPTCCTELIESYVAIDESYPRERANLFCPGCRASLVYFEKEWSRVAPPPEETAVARTRRVTKRATLKPQVVVQYGLLDGLSRVATQETEADPEHNARPGGDAP